MEKKISIYSNKYLAVFYYNEREIETKNALDPVKWEFESEADEIICESFDLI